MASLQIFIYNTDKILPLRNNYPLLLFETKDDMYNFVRRLKSIPYNHDEKEINGYFMLNNPQLLPSEVRKLHMYPVKSIPNLNSDSDSESDTEYVPLLRDGQFPIFDTNNVKALLTCDIDDNTLEPYGFSDYMKDLYSIPPPAPPTSPI